MTLTCQIVIAPSRFCAPLQNRLEAVFPFSFNREAFSLWVYIFLTWPSSSSRPGFRSRHRSPPQKFISQNIFFSCLTQPVLRIGVISNTVRGP